jgi:uncharacterized membrane protein
MLEHAMSDTTRAVLLGVFALAAAIWVGGYVAIAVVARVATRTLPPAQRVALFRGLGRSFGVVGGVALLVALGTGAGLLNDRSWDATLTVTTVVAGALIVATVIGVVQARQMTRLRRTALGRPEDPVLAGRVAQGARRASVLRTVIGLLSLTLIALGSLLAT